MMCGFRNEHSCFDRVPSAKVLSKRPVPVLDEKIEMPSEKCLRAVVFSSESPRDFSDCLHLTSGVWPQKVQDIFKTWQNVREPGSLSSIVC